MFDDHDKRSNHSMESRRTQSTAGFSLATKLPAVASSYHGGHDYYRDSTMGSASMNFPPPQPSFGYQANPRSPGSYSGGSVINNNNNINMGSASEFGSYGMPMMPASRASYMSYGQASMLPRPMSTMSGFGSMAGGYMNSNPLPVNTSTNPSEGEIVDALR